MEYEPNGLACDYFEILFEKNIEKFLMVCVFQFYQMCS